MANLRDALRRLRHPTEERTFWADSICINQANNKERGHQVSFMRDIYVNAARVLICLGSDAREHWVAAGSLLDDLNRMIWNNYKKKGFIFDSVPWPQYYDPILSDDRWTSLSVLLSQPWFKRGWVVQEACLAKDARMIWGNVEIDFPLLVRAFIWVKCRAPEVKERYQIELPDYYVDSFCLTHEWESIAFGRRIYDDMHFLNLLLHGRYLSLTDPRDRLYAFLPLIEEDDQKLLDCVDFQPDYDAPYLEVYLQFAKKLVSVDPFGSLFAVQHTEDMLREDFPSWVPRWDINLDVCLAASVEKERLRPRKEFEDVGKPSISSDNILQAKGVIFDSVNFHSEILHRSMPMHDSTLTALWRYLTGPWVTPYGSNLSLAFVETLAMGQMEGRDFKTWEAH
jgi:Heterokaryon incompatibility protein (HET)